MSKARTCTSSVSSAIFTSLCGDAVGEGCVQNTTSGQRPSFRRDGCVVRFSLYTGEQTGGYTAQPGYSSQPARSFRGRLRRIRAYDPQGVHGPRSHRSPPPNRAGKVVVTQPWSTQVLSPRGPEVSAPNSVVERSRSPSSASATAVASRNRRWRQQARRADHRRRACEDERWPVRPTRHPRRPTRMQMRTAREKQKQDRGRVSNSRAGTRPARDPHLRSCRKPNRPTLQRRLNCARKRPR